MDETEKLPEDWDNYNPCQKRDFYKLQVASVEEERNKYTPKTKDWAKIEKRRISVICKLAETIDDALTYERNHRT